MATPDSEMERVVEISITKAMITLLRSDEYFFHCFACPK